MRVGEGCEQSSRIFIRCITIVRLAGRAQGGRRHSWHSSLLGVGRSLSLSSLLQLPVDGVVPGLQLRVGYHLGSASSSLSITTHQ